MKTEITTEDLDRQDEVKTTEILNDPASFQIALGKAQMGGQEFLEVSPQLFKFLTSGMRTPYIMYGSPAVKVYEAGSKESADRMDNRTDADVLRGVKFERV